MLEGSWRMTDIGAAAMADGVNRGTLSARRLADEARRRIEARNPVLNALVDYDPAEVEPQLAALAGRLAAGEMLPLAGVPVAVKDLVWVRGRRVTQGSLLFRDFVPDRDAVAVARLRHAGAILVGMANTSEFGCKGVTTNRVYGATRHPLDARLTPGGSSGGPAVAVAAGLVPLALGTDGGGSARRPAAHTGIVGFKPSAGLIPDPFGFAGPMPSVSVMAPMGRSVADIALMVDVLTRGDCAPDPQGVPAAALARVPADLRDLRIAFTPRFGLSVPVDAAVAQATARAAERLASAGFPIRQADPVWPQDSSEDGLMPIQHAGLADLHGAAFRATPHLFDPDIAAQIESGLSMSAVQLARAYRLSREIAARIAAFFDDGIDLLIGPTTPCVAWPLDRLGPERIAGQSVGPRAHAAFTPFFNHAFCPAISIPSGRDASGLPIGLQIAGPRFADRLVLGVAALAEAAIGFEAVTASSFGGGAEDCND